MFSTVAIRPLEAVVLGFLLIAVGLVFLRRRPAGLVWVSAVAMSAIAVHLFLEEGRWQLIPAYALLFMLALWIARPAGQPYRSARPYRAGGLVVRIAVALLAALALAVPFLAPLFVVAPGAGPHPVGSATLLLEGAAGETRRTIWYPATDASATAAPYWSADDLARHSLPGLPRFAATHLALVPTPATLRAPILTERLPLLVVAPGPGALPGDHLNLVLEAAAAGWLVVRLPEAGGAEAVLETIAAMTSASTDTALVDRVDPDRVAMLVAGDRAVPDIGVPWVRVGGDRLVEGLLPSGGFSLEVPGAEIPHQALTMRYLMALPSRLIVGSSDVAPRELDRTLRDTIRTLLADGSAAAPVFSSVPPDFDELLGAGDGFESFGGLVLRRLLDR